MSFDTLFVGGVVALFVLFAVTLAWVRWYAPGAPLGSGEARGEQSARH